MAARYRARPGRLLTIALAGAVFALVFTGSAAFAADPPADMPSFEQMFDQLQSTPVYKESCTKTCHGNIATTKNYASAIIFKHGYHQLIPCSSCHTRFPHRADTTIERPSMKGCFGCHGLRHGPMGDIASGKCEDCHVTPKDRLRPAFHTFGWAGVEHVAPSQKEFNTRCAMCHQDPTTCTECHDQKGIRWAPENGWSYDAGDGCMQCHGNAALTKQTSMGSKSFEVTGVDDSAHPDVTCQQCHQDYRYDDQKAPTQLWTINASMACADCHQKSKEATLSAPVAEYNHSMHAEQIGKGNYDSATCGSCHGGHFIFKLDTEAAKARMHQSAYRVCARCKQHGDDYDTYDDYYHGKAYKTGNLDAPACWDCHEAHDILPKADSSSTVNPANVGATCGQDGCHKGSSEKFGTAAAELIHQKAQAQEDNPILKLLARIRGQG